jgi:hypothetical protein
MRNKKEDIESRLWDFTKWTSLGALIYAAYTMPSELSFNWVLFIGVPFSVFVFEAIWNHVNFYFKERLRRF